MTESGRTEPAGYRWDVRAIGRLPTWRVASDAAKVAAVEISTLQSLAAPQGSDLNEQSSKLSEFRQEARRVRQDDGCLADVPKLSLVSDFNLGIHTKCLSCLRCVVHGYKGYQAVAVGLSARVTQTLKVKIGAGVSSAATTFGAGAAYQW